MYIYYIYYIYRYVCMYVCMYVKKINYFVFIMHHVNNEGVSRRWSTLTDVKQFKSDAL